MRLRGKGADNNTAPNRRRPSQANAAQRESSSDVSERYAFRRNRTLTGSSSASVASTNELNAELRSPRAHVHHLTTLRRKLLALFAAVVLTGALLYIVVWQLAATTFITVQRTGPLPSADALAYSQAIESYYAARPIERLMFLLDRPALLSHVQAARPEVQSLMIEPSAKLGQATVSIVARTPIARWSIDGSNQYVDGDGVVFSRNYFETPPLQIVDESGIPSDSGRLVTSNRFLGFIGRVIANSAERGLNITEVTIPPLTSRQVAVQLEVSETQYKLSVDRSAGNQVEDIQRISAYLSANGLRPEYVDVRIEGKAFYR